MEQPSPYQPPAVAPPPMPVHGAPEPQAVKVFGVLHLILAGIGILSGLWGIASTQMTGMFRQFTPNAAAADAQMRFMDDLLWVTIMNAAFSLVLAGLLFTAGLKLVRSQRDGVRWSNRYAWTSIALKVVTLVVSVAFVLPTTHRMMGEMMGNTGMPPGAADNMNLVMKVSSAVGTVIGPLISCIYPALALIFMNQPRVRDWVGK